MSITLIAILASVFSTILLLDTDQHEIRKIWSNISVPEGTSLIATGDLAGPVTVSPDGSMLAFVAIDSGKQRLWVRQLQSPTARSLPGTEGATFPFWSPDSRSIGFFANEKLYTVNVSGAPPISVCSAPAGRGGSWNQEDVIIFAPAFRSSIFGVPVTGGTPEPVTKLDESKHTTHRWPSFCPDGKHFLYLAVVHGAAQAETNAVYLASLEGGEPLIVMHGSANAQVAGKYLLFPRANSLLAAPFDGATAQMLGDPTVVATDVMYDVTTWHAGFSASSNGVLVFHTGTAGGEIQIQRRDMTGKVIDEISDPGNFGSIALSPDGNRVATDVSGADTDIWVYDVERRFRTRLTFGDAANVSPIWSPDGKYLAYANFYMSRPEKPRRICRRPASGGAEETLYTSSDEAWATDWSLDGKYLLITKGKYIGGNPSDIWVLPLSADREPFPLVKTQFDEDEARFSPDGKWVSYQSNENGRWEVFIIPFDPAQSDQSKIGEPTLAEKWQVSVNGGNDPRWSRDGKKLFFISGAETMLNQVDISVADDRIEIGTPEPLFTISQIAGIDPYDLSPDGKWIVENASLVPKTSPINLILNWDAEIKEP